MAIIYCSEELIKSLMTDICIEYYDFLFLVGIITAFIIELVIGTLAIRWLLRRHAMMTHQPFNTAGHVSRFLTAIITGAVSGSIVYYLVKEPSPDFVGTILIMMMLLIFIVVMYFISLGVEIYFSQQ
ncbi:MAG: hypothetical protein ABSD81_03845 [Methanomicrobiales archaeon]